MRRLMVVFALLAVLAAASPVAAASRTGGYLPPDARPYGHSLPELAGAYTVWGFSGPVDSNPLVTSRCTQSPLDARIWFLPVSFGGVSALDCHVPDGAFLVVTPGFYECSEAEGNGTTRAELAACAADGFALLSHAELALDGRQATQLERYVVTTPLVQLDGPNLFGPDPTPSLSIGYFLVIAPLSHGTHTIWAYDEFEVFDFNAGYTYHITVG